jgi:hypothetical protein
MKRHWPIMLVAVPTLVLAVLVVSGQTAPSADTIEVGSAVAGRNATEFVGRIDQNGGDFASYGYLTHISGLTDTLLFSVFPTTTEASAHFTYYATATLTSRAVISGVFVIDSVGVTVYYYNPTPGATFDVPASFTAGTPIVTATIRSQNILNVQAPNLGISTNFGEFTQTGVSPFDLSGTTYQLGRVGLLERTFSTGEGTRTDPITPQSFLVVSGNAVVTGQSTFMPIVARNIQ